MITNHEARQAFWQVPHISHHMKFLYNIKVLNRQKEMIVLGLHLSPHISLQCRHNPSITGTIFPSIFPPLIHTGAVKLGLPQSDVDVIVEMTKPLGESMATPSVWLIVF